MWENSQLASSQIWNSPTTTGHVGRLNPSLSFSPPHIKTLLCVGPLVSLATCYTESIGRKGKEKRKPDN